ncbi:hypothetical protein TREVI0001_2051 [Treponema vincentii ATCC 35580]|uniref:Uncharacterized protein n=1 Tax=Treponema vincentii ATCC 35580 TaxID=596324 RepID=C8PQE7_9SPIR|nr:hypothetical protein TREVI0001_2051 [Treponema vincentii ATCC 35580]
MLRYVISSAGNISNYCIIITASGIPEAVFFIKSCIYL